MVGQVSQAPVQKKLKSGRTVSLFSIGTGGIRNNAGASEARDLLRILRGAGSSGIVPASIRSPWVELLWSMSNQGKRGSFMHVCSCEGSFLLFISFPASSASFYLPDGDLSFLFLLFYRSNLYVEGNLETKVFNDKITGVPSK